MEIIAYSRQQAADAMNVSGPTFDRISKMPGFPIARLGKKILIPKRELEDWLKEQCSNQ